MTDLYDELGVPRDSSDETIKKAYRRRSRKVHPDKGGSDEEMAKVNHAYSVLSDPIKRLHYDRTGQSNAFAQQPEQDRVRDLLMQLFDMTINALSATESVSILSVMRKGASGMRDGHKQTKENITYNLNKRKKLLGRLKRKKGKDKLNPFEALLKKQIKNLEDQLGVTEDKIHLLDEVVKELNNYEEDWSPPTNTDSTALPYVTVKII